MPEVAGGPGGNGGADGPNDKRQKCVRQKVPYLGSAENHTANLVVRGRLRVEPEGPGPSGILEAMFLSLAYRGAYCRRVAVMLQSSQM